MRRGLSVPAEPRTFTQTLDHFAAPTLNGTTFPQRYYLNDTAFGGPGHPLLVIMGGEGAIPPSTGFFYPWVVDVLAPRFKALVLEPEHRFYGTSVPPDAYDTATLHHLTPQQALADTVALIRSVQSSKGCSARGTAEYCPVITIGGSYPGWLSAMMRLRYPAVVDGAYAASAPMRFYAQQVDQFSYYQVITRSAEAAAAGCAKAVRAATHLLPTADTPTLVAKLNLCTPLPPYIVRGGDATAQTELLMILAVSFAGLNMGNYPPGPATGLTQACEGFLGANTTDAQWQSLRAFLGGGGGSLRHARFRAGRALVAGARSNETHHSLAGQDAEAPSRRKTRGGAAAACFNVSAALPATARHGSAGTFSCGDWSGCGTGDNGLSWDYETCTYLVEQIGTNGVTDMFPPRTWTSEWLHKHCAARFDVVPRPTELVDTWGFDAAGLRAQGASQILFTNGLNDGWSAGGFLTDVDPARDLLSLNMPNGAHHSDLSHSPPGPTDTPDVVHVRARATTILEHWLCKAKHSCGLK